MAAFDLIVIEGGKQKRKPSASNTFDFLSVRVGASNLAIAEDTGHFDFGAKRITNVATPTANDHVATKGYADSIAAGFDPKASCDFATTAALPTVAYDNGTGGVGATLTAVANGALSVDGGSPTAGMRITVKNQVAGLQNGIYVVTDAGSGGSPFILTRATDFDNSPDGEVSKGAFTLIVGGTANGGYSYFLTTSGSITIGTTALSFSQSLANVATATSSSGGGVQGKVTADSDKGLSIASGVLEVTHDGQGLQFTSGQLALELDGSTLSKGASGVKVADAGITETQLATSVAGAGLTGGAGTALAVGTGDGIDVAANAISVNYSETKTNDNGSAITARQVVYVKADGDVDLAQANNAAFSPGTRFGFVEDASIAAAASGRITVRAGRKIGGFSGLTAGDPVYVSRATAGAIQQNLTGFVAGEHVVQLGQAISTTEIVYQPQYLFEY